MIEVESVDVSGAAQRSVNGQSKQTSWREDPSLASAFDVFAHRLQYSYNGGRPVGPPIPHDYILDVIEVAETWGPQDKEIEHIGVDNRGDPIAIYHLYRDGREEYVATVVPHVARYDEIVRVSSLKYADQFFQILSDRRNRRLAALEGRLGMRADYLLHSGHGQTTTQNGKVNGVVDRRSRFR